MSFQKSALVVGLITFVLLFMFGMGTLGFFNTSTTLITTYEAKIDANKADFDNMWKTISQVAKVPGKYKDDFQDTFTSYVKARQGGNTGEGALLSFLTEAVPNFDGKELYAKVQTVVEAKREGWTQRQKELRDLKREHDTLIRTFPGLAYNALVGHAELAAVVITSGRTEETFDSGQDDNVDLF